MCSLATLAVTRDWEWLEPRGNCDVVDGRAMPFADASSPAGSRDGSCLPWLAIASLGDLLVPLIGATTRRRATLPMAHHEGSVGR